MKRARTFSDLHTLSRNEKLSFISRIEHGEASREELKAASDLLSQCLLPRPRGRPKLETKSDTEFAIRAIELGCIFLMEQTYNRGDNYDHINVEREGIREIATENNITVKEARRKYAASMTLLVPFAIKTADRIDASIKELQQMGKKVGVFSFVSEKMPENPIQVLVVLFLYQHARGITGDNTK